MPPRDQVAMPKNIANCEASVGNLRQMAQSKRNLFRFPGRITEEQAHALGKRIRLGAMTPEQVGIFLGYKVPRNKTGYNKPSASWLASIEAAVVEWLPALGLELHVEIGRTSDSANAGTERYVDFRVPSTKQRPPTTEPKLVGYRDPSLATWTKQEADRKVAERKQRRADFWGGAA